MKKAVAIFCACAVGLLITCAKKDNPAGPGSGSNSNTYTYSMSGNTAISSYPQTISVSCDSNNILVSDTSYAYIDTTTITLLNNDNLMVSKHTDGYSDTLTRVGTGSGVQGEWTNSYGMTIQVGVNTVTESYNYADMLVVDLSFMTSYYNVSIVKISSNQVSITGNSSHEVVTITVNSSTGDATYSSSVASHAAATEYANPTSCPNDGPAWLEQFLTANPKTAKNAMAVPLNIIHKLATLLTKKPAHRR